MVITEDTTLSETFLKRHSKTKVNIPIYQRGFDWETSHIVDLWNDVLDHDTGGKYESEHHFFGFIWAIRKSEEMSSLQTWEIVDGQQRITSSVLLLIAIRDFCYKRLQTQMNFDNLFYVYVNFKCKNCGKKTHYFRDALDKDGNSIKRKQEGYLDQGDESGKNHAWVSCVNCSSTMDAEVETDADGNKLNYIIMPDDENKLKLPKAPYLKKKEISEFKNCEDEIIKLKNEHSVDAESKCYDIDVKNIINRIEEILYIYDTSNSKPSGVPIIKLGVINNDFFENTILKKMTPKSKIDKIRKQKNELTDTTNKISDAYQTIIKLLEEYYDKKTTGSDSKIDKTACRNFYNLFNGTLDTILHQFQFNQIIVTDENEAYKRFDTINNRGVGLANQDLIKTRIFTKLYEKLSEQVGSTIDSNELIVLLNQYENKWTEIRQRINPKNKSDYSLEKLLHHFIVIKYGHIDSRISDIFTKITEILTSKDPKDLINEIDLWSKNFEKIRNPKSYDWDQKDKPEIEWYLNTIREYGSEICYHVILASYEKHWNSEKPNKKLFSEIISLSHRNFVRNKTIGKVSQNEIEYLYKKIAREIVNDQDFNVDKIQSMFLNNCYIPDSKIKSSLNLKYNWYTSKTIKYFLEEISNSMGTGYSPESTIQIEHIMPINFNNDWKNHLTNKKSISDDSAKNLHDVYLHELGNLTLISKKLNTSIKDALFKTKLGDINSKDQCYLKEQSYGITSKLDYYKKDDVVWTDVEIIDRAKKLMKKIMEILDINLMNIPQNFTYENENKSGDTRADWYDCLD